MKVELRIGNYVKCVDGNTICIDKDDMIYILSNTFDVEPIPLSEEVLLKCGFEEDETHVSEDHPWAIWVKNDVVISLPYFEFSFESTDVEIKYLHQLQNLYYALTGEELEVSL